MNVAMALIVVTQLGQCLGNYSPECRVQRQLEEQERQNRMRDAENERRHQDLMYEMRRQRRQDEFIMPRLDFGR